MIPIIDPYSSHLPLLVYFAALAKNRIVELGSGLYSTPILSNLCEARQCDYIVFDNDREWLNRVKTDYGNATVVDHWGDLDKYGELLRCDVCFIDVAPAESRAPLVRLMRRWAKIIIVHDTETEQRHNYPELEEALASFPYRTEDRRRGPWTTAVSDLPLSK